MDATTLAAFAVAFLVFAASPGPDNVTVVTRTVTHGAASGIAYGAGTTVGVLAFLVLAALGLSAVAAGMGTVMTVLRYAGAAYLVWMGVRLWTAPPTVPAPGARAGGRSLIGTFATGVALNLGNPKMPLFYVALLPNIVGPSLTPGQVGLLAAVILAVEVLVVGTHVALASRARRALRDPAVVRRTNRIAGGLMVGAGIAVVATR